MNNCQPRLIITDLDFTLSQAIDQVFPATFHLFSQYKLLHKLKKHFGYLGKRKSATSKLLYQHIIDAVT